MAIQVIAYKETYRLITDGNGHYAVVESRCNRVYSLHGHHRREGPDSEEGMACVVGKDGWCDEATARCCFERAVKGELYLKQMLW